MNLLPWCIKTIDKEEIKEKDVEKDKEKKKGNKQHFFKFLEMLDYCHRGAEELHEEEKQNLFDILTEDQLYLEDESNQMYREISMNCSLLENTTLVRKPPKRLKLESLSNMLACEENISLEHLDKYHNCNNDDKIKILDVLKCKSTVCGTSMGSEDRMIVIDPYLTIKTVTKIRQISRDSICLMRLMLIGAKNYGRREDGSQNY